MEEWRDAVGYGGKYMVSSLGRVRSMPTKYHPRVTILSPYIVGRGKYRVVHLSGGGDSGRARRTVHSLVAEAFLGPRPDGKVVCHRNGNTGDNRKSNLRYDTQSNNLLDRKQHGTYSSEAHGMAKLTARKVRVIRAKLSRGVKPPTLSAEYGVTRETIYLIRDRKIWRDL